jgi:SAM-dependent methyltransferase
MEIDFSSYKDVLGENDYSFIQRVYEGGFGQYENRLRAIGFEGMDKVLDAGCGFGQWSFALANLNKTVCSTDLSSIRVKLGTELAGQLNKDNMHFRFASLEEQPFGDNEFDAIFCFQAIFLSDPKKVLKEFHRMLKPGGKLYVNANGLGWSLNLWKNSPYQTTDYNPRANVAKAFQNTVNYGSDLPIGEGQLIIEPEEMAAWVTDLKFKILGQGGDADINLRDDIEMQPFFKSEYYGFTGIHELLVEK